MFKLGFLLLLSLALTNSKPSQLDQAVIASIKNLAQGGDRENLCKMLNQMLALKSESIGENDTSAIDNLINIVQEEITAKFGSYKCQPLVTILTTSTTTTPVPLPPTTVENLEEFGENDDELCNDCEVDYDVQNDNRENFSRVLDDVETRGFSAKTIGMFAFVGIFGIIMASFVIIVCLKMFSCF